MSGRLALRTIRPLTRRTPPLAPFRQFARYESNFRIQRVKIRRRLFTWKRVSTWALYTTSTLWLIEYLISPTDLEIEEASQGTGVLGEEEEDEEEWDEEDGLFLPLTWATPRPRTFYKGTDPEWQEFVRFSKDQKKMKKVREDIVALVRGRMANDKNFCSRVGPIDVTKGSFWLDIIFPEGPPQDYERTGLFYTGDAILWGSKTVTQINQRRLEHALNPTPTATALFASGVFMFKYYVLQLKETFGMNDSAAKQPPSVLDVITKAQEAAQNSPKAVTNTQSGTEPAKPDQPPMAPDAVAKNTPPKAPSSFGPKPSEEEQPKTPVLQQFRRTFARNVKPKGIEPPRGSIVISGITEVLSTKSKCIMEIQACYDPKADKLLTLRADLKRIQPRQQRPRGGN